MLGNGVKDRLADWIARHLPKRVVYYAYLEVVAFATGTKGAAFSRRFGEESDAAAIHYLTRRSDWTAQP